MSNTNGLRRAFADDYRYVGSCGMMNVQTASLIIGIVEASWVLIAIPHTVFSNGAELVTELVLLAFTAVVSVYLFAGIRTERADFLTPFLVSLVIQSVLIFIALLGSLIALVSPSETLRDVIDESIRDLEVVQALGASYTEKALYLSLLYLIVFALKVWSFLIIKKCRCYFRDQAQFRPVAMKYARHMPDEENQTVS